MKKFAFIIPWFWQKSSEKEFLEIKSYFEKNWFSPILVDINRKRKTMSDYVKEFISISEKYNWEKYVFWFSFWAMIAFLSNEKINSKKLILASLSPYFKEDLPNNKKSWLKILWKNRIKDFEKIIFKEKILNFKKESYLLYWELERQDLKNRSLSFKTNKNSKITEIKNSYHELTKNYLNEIKKIIEII